MKKIYVGALLIIVCLFRVEAGVVRCRKNQFREDKGKHEQSSSIQSYKEQGVPLCEGYSPYLPCSYNGYSPDVNYKNVALPAQNKHQQNSDKKSEDIPYSFYEFSYEYYYPQTSGNQGPCYTYFEDGTVFYRCD